MHSLDVTPQKDLLNVDRFNVVNSDERLISLMTELCESFIGNNDDRVQCVHVMCGFCIAVNGTRVSMN